MEIKIYYDLNSGDFAPKDEVKEEFLTDLYIFVNEHYDTELKTIALTDFITSAPYLVGNLAGKYFLKEVVGGKVEDQPTDYFIGYCYSKNKYVNLIPHLIHFFALWREIEQCMEPNASDFFANSWASLVDTAKFFKYTTVEDLKKSPEAPQVRDEKILYMLQNCPDLYETPYAVNPSLNLRFPKPKREGYEFAGWYNNANFNGDVVKYISKDLTNDVKYYARWATHTFFHSNDGYATFDDLYTDFLNDFSNVVGIKVGKTTERMTGHGPVSEFCKISFDGNLNKFFAVEKYNKKWMWLINYLRSLKKNDEELRSRFDFVNGKFGLEAQVRWELNSLFVTRFHLVWPKTGDYSGAGVKEKIADTTNSSILKVKYLVGDHVSLPKIHRDGYVFEGWYDNYNDGGKLITGINDDRFASKTVYAKWRNH
ncbi:MAG: hypothetical protein K0Q49_1884 [Haloplasmataceae bacterium]|jgi:uncharacterized repeat protein (TIGR02543 family)|nr:hypothetical protein [Haloplasmataceae bacterium]